MPEPKPDRKRQILAAASELLQTKGYEGFSYQDLADQLGIAKPSIHHHFATKEALAAAILEHYRVMIDEEIERQLGHLKDQPAEQLRIFLDVSAQDVECNECAMCPIGAIHANYAVFPASVQAGVRSLSDSWHDWWTELLRRGRTLGQIHFSGTPEEAAWAISSMLMGARQQARTSGGAVFRQVAAQIKRDWLSTP